MAMGAWRISRERVLTRRAAAIEALGSATVLCTDKTGTLTENRMSIAELRLADGAALRVAEHRGEPLPETFRELVRYGVLASARGSVRSDGDGVSRARARCTPQSAPEHVRPRSRVWAAARPARRDSSLAEPRRRRVRRRGEGSARSDRRAVSTLCASGSSGSGARSTRHGCAGPPRARRRARAARGRAACPRRRTASSSSSSGSSALADPLRAGVRAADRGVPARRASAS